MVALCGLMLVQVHTLASLSLSLISRSFSGFTWAQQGGKLMPGAGVSGTNVGYGSSCAFSADGSTIVVGAPFANGGQGQVFVSTRSGLLSDTSDQLFLKTYYYYS